MLEGTINTSEDNRYKGTQKFEKKEIDQPILVFLIANRGERVLPLASGGEACPDVSPRPTLIE
ncbi:hypothetical protein CA13_36630 [Planctomycetes bacterium CA13]|uniref:Uncharacterized protein n=1 Tax=Novipirellula herctigrandis TaxID=2527986 RepID=A0A5C5Z4B9_9BACT|nr:hypothetical protein CA13_36630 [Planctomycetes bacterium CA13]